MKQTLLLFTTFFILFSTSRAQFLPGQFYYESGYSNSIASTHSCVLDSSFYTIRYGGVETFSAATDSVHYLYDRFYPARAIKPGPDSSLIVLKNGLIYRYFPATDSMANISGTLAATVTDIDVADSVIWAIVAFNQIGRYTDSTGWTILTLGSSFNPSHILAQTDTSAYLADNTDVRLYSGHLSASLYSAAYNSSLSEWSVDKAGNAWMIIDQDLVKLTPTGGTTILNAQNAPLNIFGNSYEQYNHVVVDTQGTIWASTNNGHLLQDTTAWGIFIFDNGSDYINGLAADHATGAVYVQAASELYIIKNNFISGFPFGNYPYQNAKAISPDYLANDQGIFNYGRFNSLVPAGFKDTSAAPYANDVTCFVVNNAQIVDSGYGTHHGVFSTAYPINNTQLPDTNINYLYYMNGSYYIGTNKGLCIYNQIVYTTYDTSNSALPSDTVTFVISYLSPYTHVQELWVGTTAGVALYSNGVWTRYDTSVVHIASFRVTGILPCPLYYMDQDTSVWVSTMGSGLVKLRRNGSYTLLNTANGGMQDDSLYYISQYDGCFYYGVIVVGTNSHGIAYFGIPADSFQYQTIGYGNSANVTYHSSPLYANPYTTNFANYNNTGFTMLTDGGIYVIGMCVGIGIHGPEAGPQSLKWYQLDDDKLRIELPADFSGATDFYLYDMTGRRILSSTQATQPDVSSMIDIATVSSGVYILQAINGANGAQGKVIISK